MAEKRAWLTDPTTGEKLHAWSHVKSIFYNKAANILLKDKLDEMDRIIDKKIAKALMSNVQVNDANKVPTSALAYAMQQAITNNANAITQLNSDRLKNINVSDQLKVPADVFKYAERGDIPVLMTINYTCPAAADYNVMHVFLMNYLAIAISASGKIYRMQSSESDWVPVGP